MASEADRGLLIGRLVGAGLQVYAVNPMSVARCPERQSRSGAKSDPGMPRCRPNWTAPTQSGVSPATVSDGNSQGVGPDPSGSIRTRQRQVNQLRSALCEFHPAAWDSANSTALSVGAPSRPTSANVGPCHESGSRRRSPGWLSKNEPRRSKYGTGRPRARRVRDGRTATLMLKRGSTTAAPRPLRKPRATPSRAFLLRPQTVD